MPNVINYAEKWQPELLAIQIQNTLTSPFIVSAESVNWLGAKTFHFTHLETTGFKNHSRAGGWNRGNITEADHPFTLAHDRDVEFLVDKLDVDESNYTAKAENVASTFERTKSSPEIDARFFEQVSKAAINTQGRSQARANLAYYTKANILDSIKAVIGKVRAYRGSTIVYIHYALMDLLESALGDKASISWTTISDYEFSIETRVARVDGVPIMEVDDITRFATKFNYAPADGNGGFAVSSDASEASTASAWEALAGKQIAILAASTATCFTVTKVISIYFHQPGEHTEGDGYLYQHRSAWDTFVLPNGLNGVIDSIYVEYLTA